jgi:hypothetical protein
MNAFLFLALCISRERLSCVYPLLQRSNLFLIATLLIIDYGTTWSQNTQASLNGTVVDAANGETLPGANVILLPTQQGAATDRNGRFFISNIAPGKHRLQVSFIGYETHKDSLVLTDGHLRYLRIALKPQPLALPEVTVSAERGRLTREVNLGQDFISSQELRMTSSVAEPDLFRSLALLPGVVQANDFNSRFYVRGGQGNENHVLVEGMTIHNPYHALGFFSTFDVDAIKAVEVYRGIFPVRYCERLSSVTNVILRDGNAQQISGLGMVSLASSKFLLEGPLIKYQPQSGRKWTFMLNGRRTYADAVVDYPLYFYDFAAKSVYDSGRKTRFILHSFFGFDRLAGTDDLVPFPNIDFSDIKWNNRALGLQWHQFLSPQSSWISRLSYSDFRSQANDTQFDYTGSLAHYRQENSIREISFNTEWNGWLWNANRLTLGYGFSRFNIDQYLDNFFRQVFQGNWRSNDQHKIYGTVEGGWKDHWLYEIGAAWLYFPTNRAHAFAPRLGAKYLINDAWRLKAGVGRHYQFLTTLNDDDDPIILFDAWIPTSPDRPIARADHFGLGIEVGRSSTLEADVELYYNRYGSLTRYNRSQRPGEAFYLNGWGESYGMEIRAHYSLNTFYGFANYSLGHAISHFFLRNQPMRFANDFRWQTFSANSDVRHIFNGVIGIRPGGKWDFSVAIVYQSGRPYTAVLGSTMNLVDLPSFPPFHYSPYDGHPMGLYLPNGTTDYIYSSKNGLRYPFYQRVDFRAARNFSWWGMDWTFFAQIYNIFFRKNAAFHFPDISFGRNEHPTALPIVPTFGLTMRF